MLSMKCEMVHAATVQAYSIGTLMTTLPTGRQNGFDMAFTVNDNNTQHIQLTAQHATTKTTIITLAQSSKVNTRKP